ncbi:FG-GAP-like repeat-containing protein [Streptomyces sp. BHT-5-2]|uniref:FG-GAP-like repeat-containing protein n=1 Tax=unclassified Streptomyces TaxID=2593676 RepID=UPI001C8E4BC4|nr:FG-GAP-like repeat-containing protein [Streptomyces sp. BHT-5-2]QZL03324.1 FG-GAP-like repeat-containing protein [Streptomyces sp. BHT-5-2]
MRAISWNICGEAGGDRGEAGYCPYRNAPEQKVDQVKQLVDEHQANVVMLQEVCGNAPGSHVDLLHTKLGPEWSVRHAVGARESDGAAHCRNGLKGELGVALAVKGAIEETTTENTLPADPSGKDEQTLPILCATVRGWTTRVCTTHIKSGEDPRVGQQILNVERHLGADANTDVLLGGDFNRNADAAQMKPLTDSLDRAIDGYTYRNTNKLDHFFFTRAVGSSRVAHWDIDKSRMDTSPNEPDSGEPNGYSDHAPIIVYLRGAPVPGDMTGDGRPDMVAVDDAGRLRLYSGRGDGTFTGGHRVIGTGGWSGAAVTHRGDYTGDGREDLIARIGGELWLYPNNGDGTLGARVRIGSGLPADSQIVSVGDLTGDGHPDLVAGYDDKLWLYPGDPADKPHLKPRIQIGARGWAPMTLTAPGDATGDGRPDLLVRESTSGILWLYRGRPDGTFDDRTPYGRRGWNPLNRPLIAGGADADRNGIADLWATTREGTLLHYAGGRNADGDPVDGEATVVGRSGWQNIESLA